jgi:hypothetical protein
MVEPLVFEPGTFEFDITFQKLEKFKSPGTREMLV